MSAVGGNLYAGTLAGVWEMNLGGQPVCSQKTVNPSGLTVPSTGGTWRFDLFIAGSCSWTATNPRGYSCINGCWLVHRSLLRRDAFVSESLLRLAGACRGRVTDTPARASPTTNGRIDIPTAGYVAELVSAHPRPRPRGSSASNARLTTSLMDNPLAAANVRTRRTRLWGSLTVNASLASLGGTGCFSR
jgi:hypothetical protein